MLSLGVLVVGRWLFDVCLMLFVAQCSLLSVRCFLFVVCCCVLIIVIVVA